MSHCGFLEKLYGNLRLTMELARNDGPPSIGCDFVLNPLIVTVQVMVHKLQCQWIQDGMVLTNTYIDWNVN